MTVVWPAPAAKLTSLWNEVRGKWADGSTLYHHGLDFGIPINTPLVSIADGKTVKEGWLGDQRPAGWYDGIYQTGPSMGGLCLWVDHPGGYQSRYCHLERTLLAIGATVKAGQTVAMSGNTGYSTGPHLHFELFKDGVNIDPLPILKAGAFPATGKLEDLRHYGLPRVRTSQASPSGGWALYQNLGTKTVPRFSSIRSPAWPKSTQLRVDRKARITFPDGRVREVYRISAPGKAWHGTYFDSQYVTANSPSVT